MSIYDQKLIDIYKTSGVTMDWRIWAEPWSLLNATGPVKSLNVLDVACGTGIISRLMVHAGAAHVTAIDLSSEILEQARKATSEKNVHYMRQAIEDYQAAALHDLTISNYLFNEALSPEQLRQFCISLHQNLKHQGRLVTLMHMPDRIGNSDYSRYGFSFQHQHQLNEGDPLVIEYEIDSVSFTLQLNYYSPEFVQETLENCGFCNVCMHALGPSPAGIKAMSPGYWNILISRPPLIIISAVNTQE
ncbi:class I SAM-dependent methyltransferase [Endozoicomonadaceae bacterium StTr2]